MGTPHVIILLGFLLFVIQCAVSVPTPESPPRSAKQQQGSGSSLREIPQSFLDQLFKGETKEKVNELVAADLQYLQQRDAVDKVKQQIKETENDLKFKTDYFKKMANTHVMTKEYYDQMEQNYKKYEQLIKDEKDWTRVEKSIPPKRWRKIESGTDVLQSVQNAKERVQSQLKKLKPQHDVYESQKNDIEKDKQSAVETRQQVYKTTLNDLSSQLQGLTEEKEHLEGDLETEAAKKENVLLSAAKSWINRERNDWDIFMGNVESGFQKFLQSFCLPSEFPSQAKDGALWDSELYPVPSIIRALLEEGFQTRVQNLVFEYETSKNKALAKRTQNDDITKSQKETEVEKMMYNMENKILAGNRYELAPLKHSENPLQRENALLDIIDKIVTTAKATRNTKLQKEMAREIASQTKLLENFIASNNACNTKNKSFNLADNQHSEEIDRALKAFESAAYDLVMVAPVDEENARKKQEEVDKRLRLVQEMMDDLSGMANCVQTMMRMQATVNEVEAWRAKL